MRSLLAGVVGRIDDPEQLRELLDAVLVVGQGLDLDQALQRIVDVAARVLDARYCALGVRAEGGQLLREFVYTGIDAATRATMGALPVGHGVLGVLISDPRVLRIGDLSGHPQSVGFPPNHPPMKTFLGAPIMVRGEVFGSIYLTEKHGAPQFSGTDEALISVLAVAAGVAVDNARLFEQTRVRQRWVEVLARRGSEPLAGIALPATLDGLCRDVADLTGAAIVTIATNHADTVRPRGRWVAAGSDAPDADAPGSDAEESSAEADAPGVITEQPLMAGDDPIGSVVLHHYEPPHLAQQDLAGLAGVAEIASLAIAYDERQQIAHELEVLADRHRIARDLHDHVIQRLFAVGMALQTMSMGPEVSASADLADRVNTVINDLDATVAQIRTSIFDLQTSSRAGTPSPPSLRRRLLDVVEQVTAHTRLSPAVRFDGTLDTVVDDVLASHIEAVVREAMSNVVRHSGAAAVEVVVACTATAVTVGVTDDGCGLSANVQHRGLRNLADRAIECGGSLELAAGPSGGTVLTWTAPWHRPHDGLTSGGAGNTSA